MITKKELQQCREILGKTYRVKILKYFELKNITREDGKKFKPQEITNFFNGRYNLHLHQKVIESVGYYKSLQQALKRKQNSILSNKKAQK